MASDYTIGQAGLVAHFSPLQLNCLSVEGEDPERWRKREGGTQTAPNVCLKSHEGGSSGSGGSSSSLLPPSALPELEAGNGCGQSETLAAQFPSAPSRLGPRWSGSEGSGRGRPPGEDLADPGGLQSH